MTLLAMIVMTLSRVATHFNEQSSVNDQDSGDLPRAACVAKPVIEELSADTVAIQTIQTCCLWILRD
jgi:hypothetical protein